MEFLLIYSVIVSISFIEGSVLQCHSYVYRPIARGGVRGVCTLPFQGSTWWKLGLSQASCVRYQCKLYILGWNVQYIPWIHQGRGTSSTCALPLASENRPWCYFKPPFWKNLATGLSYTYIWSGKFSWWTKDILCSCQNQAISLSTSQ